METPSPVWPKAEAPPPPAQKRVVLKSVVCCRLEMTKLYREMRNGRLDIQDGSRLANVVMLIQRSFVETELADRIAALEQAQ